MFTILNQGKSVIDTDFDTYFIRALANLPYRWQSVIDQDGDYFEGHVNLIFGKHRKIGSI